MYAYVTAAIKFCVTDISHMQIMRPSYATFKTIKKITILLLEDEEIVKESVPFLNSTNYLTLS